MVYYGFLVAHGYEILKGFVVADTREEAINKILDGKWNDIIDEYDSDELTEGYEIVEIWEYE